MGDPAGVGPELALKIGIMPVVQRAARLVFIGSEKTFTENARLLGLPLPWSADVPKDVRAELIDIGDAKEPITCGEVSAEAGRLSFAAVERGIAMALDGSVDGIVTAPISKDAWHRAGMKYPGHTELLADRSGVDDFALMLVLDDWRVLHVSTHVSLRHAIDMVTEERILRMLRLFDEGLRALGCTKPVIGVAGLNPHASEGGLFGDEEARIIAPAIVKARSEGIEARGPIPPDTVFARGRTTEFDGVLAMYHDQGHVAVKTLTFEPGADGRWAAVHGVNMTVGLPIVRTSVDHGVAFDIAGQGIARPESMVEAVLLGARVAAARKTRSSDATRPSRRGCR